LLSVIELKADTHIVEEVKGLEVIQALIWIQEAWKRVSAETIRNCFKKAGFAIDVPTDLETIEDNQFCGLGELISQLPIKDQMSVHEYVSIDEEFATEDTSDEWESRLVNACLEISDNESDEDVEESTHLQCEVQDITYKEALLIINKLSVFLQPKHPELIQNVESIKSTLEAAVIKRKCEA
jgi:hypothetical protein